MSLDTAARTLRNVDALGTAAAVAADGACDTGHACYGTNGVIDLRVIR